MKKKKKKGSRKAKDGDINMLNVEQVDDENDSQYSSRGHAQHVDLSNAMGDTPANQYGAMGSGRNRAQGQSMMPSIKDTP